MRILFLTQRVPFPPNRGDKIPSFHQITHLAKSNQVEVLCLAEDDEEIQNLSGIASAVHFARAFRIRKWISRIQSLATLFTSQPITLAHFHHNEIRPLIERRHSKQPYDVAIAFSSSMAQYIEKLDLPKVMQFVDLDSFKWAQYATEFGWPMSWIYRREARTLRRYEKRIAKEFDISVVITPSERADLERLIPGVTSACLPNGIDLDKFHPMPEIAKEPHTVVFTGIMDYFPNVQGAVWFVKNVFPLLKARYEQFRFIICGARPTKEVLRLQRTSGVEVTGKVPAVQPYLARGSVGVVPLQLGRGLQNKLLEAMAVGLPCVATPKISASIHPEVLGVVSQATTALEFADRIQYLFENPQWAKDQSERG